MAFGTLYHGVLEVTAPRLGQSCVSLPISHRLRNSLRSGAIRLSLSSRSRSITCSVYQDCCACSLATGERPSTVLRLSDDRLSGSDGDDLLPPLPVSLCFQTWRECFSVVIKFLFLFSFMVRLCFPPGAPRLRWPGQQHRGVQKIRHSGMVPSEGWGCHSHDSEKVCGDRYICGSISKGDIGPFFCFFLFSLGWVREVEKSASRWFCNAFSGQKEVGLLLWGFPSLFPCYTFDSHSTSSASPPRAGTQHRP